MKRTILWSLSLLLLLTQCKSSKDANGVNSRTFSKKILVGASITSVKIKKFPAYTKDGSKWDSFAPFSKEADLYVVISQLNNTIYKSETKEDCQSEVEHIFASNLPFEIRAFATDVKLEIFDEDGVSNDDNVGYFVFRPVNYEKKNVITLASSDASLIVELGVTWIYN